MSNYFYNGYRVRICDRLDKTNVLVKVDSDRNLPTMIRTEGSEHMVAEASLEPLVDEMFEIGDRVARIEGSFVGTVTGFELSTNSVVCVSDKIRNYANDRVRYVYKAEEVALYDEANFEFELGKQYTINDTTCVVALQHPSENGCVVLYNHGDSRSIVKRVVPKNISRLSLANLHGIYKIR